MTSANATPSSHSKKSSSRSSRSSSGNSGNSGNKCTVSVDVTKVGLNAWVGSIDEKSMTTADLPGMIHDYIRKCASTIRRLERASHSGKRVDVSFRVYPVACIPKRKLQDLPEAWKALHKYLPLTNTVCIPGPRLRKAVEDCIKKQRATFVDTYDDVVGAEWYTSVNQVQLHYFGKDPVVRPVVRQAAVEWTSINDLLSHTDINIIPRYSQDIFKKGSSLETLIWLQVVRAIPGTNQCMVCALDGFCLE